MAHVAISSNNLSAIRQKIRRMESAELNSLGKAALVLDETDCDDIERHIWGEHFALMATLPIGWLRHSDDIQVTFERSEDKSDPENPVHEFIEVIKATVPRKLRIPPKSTAGSQGRFKLRDAYENNTLMIKATVLRAERTQPVFDHLAMDASVQHRWNGVAQQVGRFVENSKSLNEAIKLWPQLEIYIPQELMAKLAEKKTATKTTSRAAELLKELDTEAAIASATLARLAQSANV